MGFLSSLLASFSQRDKLLLACIILTTLGCLLSLAIPSVQLTKIYHGTGFYLLFASFVYWLYLILPRKSDKAALFTFISQQGWVLLLFTVIVALMFFVSPIQFRVLADETNLLGIANSMYQEHSFANRTSSLLYFQQQHEITSEWGIRPNLFPFMIYLMHSIKGYSAYNGFIVNFIAGVSCLWSFYWLLSRFFQQSLALLGAITLAAFPVFVLWVTSSGFEIVNLALALIAFCWFYQYQQDHDGYHLERLALTLVLLAQTRYESAVFVFTLGAAVLLMLRVPHLKKLSFRLAILPLFFLPIAWQRVIKTNKGDYQVTGDDAIFSIDNWLKHIDLAWQYFSTDKDFYGTIAAVFYLALIGMAIACVQLIRKRKTLSTSTTALLIASSLSLLALNTVVFAYFWGNLTAAFTIRLGIIFLPFIIALAIYAIQQLADQFALHHRASTKALLVAGFSLCLFYWPTAGKNEAASQLTLNRQYHTLLNYLETHYPERNILIITDRPGMYSVHEWGAVNFRYADKHQQRIKNELKRKLYQDVLVLQLIEYDTDDAIKGTALKADFDLEIEFESQHSATAKMRISHIKKGQP
ncbi:MAG: glycosyltransferase family 39 protein [Pseudomonadales bacterium]|nr:glycosyltransferase family 39 protein [Pseudomonadales bacterium]